jgi:acetyltransferase-like isoleucine patch superfamily enzyme
LRRFWAVIRQELGGLRSRVIVCRLLLWPLPDYVGGRIRVRLLRAAGFRRVDRTVVMWSLPSITGAGNVHERLEVGRFCRFNVGCFLNLGETIRIGDHVGFGQQVMILTETHGLGPPGRRSGQFQAEPVEIGDGCWVGARATILPGVTIGEGSVVAAGAVVSDDVRAHTVVGGVPARTIAELARTPTSGG